MNPLSYLAVQPLELMARHAKTFAFAATVLSQEQLAPIARLYQLCRVIDDCADEMAREEGRECLRNFRKSLTDGDDAFARAFREVEAYGVERRHLSALIEGGIFDLDQRPIEKDLDLLHYCYLVAGVVGLMMCPLLGVRKQDAKSYARDLGIAMQITNICRDVRADAQLGRTYLPGLSVNSAALAETTRTPQEVKLSLSKWLDEADRYYESGYRGLAFLPIRARFSILIAGQVYRAIGDKIRRHDFDVHHHGRFALSKPEKIFVACTALARVFKKSFWRPPGSRKDLGADKFLRTVEELYA